LLIKSKAEASKGRDNYGRNKSPRQLEQSSAQPAKKEKKLIDENEAVYGIGYLNPAFDDNQCTVISTPESSPIDVPHRSRKSSAKSEKVKARIVDVSRTVRRKLDMSSVPDVVQTSQPQVAQMDDDLPSPCSDVDMPVGDEEEFFLSKNSKLFSQVSSNTLTTTETFDAACAQQNPFRIVEVKEMEIVKSVASPEDHVILPSANVSVGLVPQVVERVEIVEDTETEAESIDTDTEDKDGKGKMTSAVTGTAEQVVNKKKDFMPILKKKAPEPPARNIKRLVLKLDLDTDQETDDLNKAAILYSSTPLKKIETDMIEAGPSNQQLTGISNMSAFAWKDSESIAEYLILDDEEIGKLDTKLMDNKQTNNTKSKDSLMIKKDRNSQKEVTSAKSAEHYKTHEIAGRSEEDRNKKSVKRTKNLSKYDTLEDCDSFYGSDKETDDVLIFSDDTEIDVGSSSSDGEDTNLGEHVEHLLDKVTRVLRTHAAATSVSSLSNF